MIRTGRISCHSDAVLCLASCANDTLLVSGGEDHRLCFTDAAGSAPQGSLELPGDIPAVAAHPSQQHVLYAASETSIYCLDLRKALGPEAVCGSVTLNFEEVNALSLNATGGWLAAGDDAGERTLRRGHANLVTAVAFRPRSQWEVVSGGADCQLVHWDAGRLRQVSSARLQPLENGGGSPGQMLNPPMVHALAFLPGDRDRVAVARGDGHVALHRLAPPVLVSGGNDGRLLVHTPIPHVVGHGRKLNDLHVAGGRLYVADVSPHLSVYTPS
ncbi:WD repeat-containing protein 53 [Auxenochlorella protothecoides]|uniref:WD repeat-containing protein 53 n=1 Tax=Auxenochlorella protothecoides TaxID=3075 RepID=A0A087SDV3_AUXPR|nr:WD repeat-containing protein 53 [Auxenochlorella protothecoides]KFM23907.1 WD repeat-containing protein 53 [Auxenochlorella protothecoides]